MEMTMEFRRKLPTPKEIKEEYPVSEKVAKIKEERDKIMQDIFEGRDERLLLIIGPCSADNEEAVVDYMHRLRKVQDEIIEK
nr:3-deoxy-7-phosphoheptulonate synthase [Lachnospiraceae bacterium]